jgi:hypothetical protein
MILQDLRRGLPPATAPPHGPRPSHHIWLLISALWNQDTSSRPSAAAVGQVIERPELPQNSVSLTNRFFPAAWPPISDDTATRSNIMSMFRRNTAPSSWVTKLAGLLSGIPDAKEPTGPLTDICGAIGLIFKHKRVRFLGFY